MKISTIVISLNIIGLSGLTVLELIRTGAVSGAVSIGWCWLVIVALTVWALFGAASRLNTKHT